MFAYTDESGQTGLDIFHEAQPVFWTLTLLSPVDLDDLLRPRHAAWLKELGASRLHGSQLGLRGIERLAASAQEFLEVAESRLVLTFIHKPYFGAVKFVDTVLDSGLNRAVDSLHYGFRPLRLPLTYALVSSMTLDDVRDFWAAYASGSTEQFARVVQRVKSAVLKWPDRRARQLLDDALAWAFDHPNVFLEARRSNLDAPNLVALSLIVGVLHQYLGFDGGQVLRFVHDQQQQFGRALKEMFDVVKQLSPKQRPVTSLLDWEAMTTFRCPLELTSSAESPALQLVDCLLWLLQRAEDLPAGSAPACRDLIAFTSRRTLVSEFTFHQLSRDVEAEHERMLRLPATAEGLARAQQLLAEMETIRKARMVEEDR
ncbi:MAG TPA: hypothetical protein VGM51_01820 [Armatimonadota bacterium]